MRLFLKVISAVAVVVLAKPVITLAADTLTSEDLDHVHWKISSFLEGDTLKVRDLLNGPLEQALSRKADKLKRVTDDEAFIAAKEDAAGLSLRGISKPFAKMQDDLVEAKTQMLASANASNTASKMAAKDRADALQQQIIQQEDQSLAKDPEVIDKQKEIKETREELRTLAQAIVSAGKARDQNLDGLRLTQKIPGPPTVGAKGILGRIKPITIVDATSFTTEFDALEVTGEAKTGTKGPDGFKALTGKSHLIHLLVTGVDTSKMHAGTETLLDSHFSIIDSKQKGKAMVYTVAPSEKDEKEQAIDHLFDLLDNLRVQQ